MSISEKHISQENGNFKKTVFMVKLLFSYHPGNQAFTYNVYNFSSLNIMN